MAGPSRLLAIDFDGTSHLTSEPSPDGNTVDSAYAEAIAQHIGTEARDVYLEGGGHNHRSATAIVDSLLPDAPLDLWRRTIKRVTNTKLDILMDSVGQPLSDGTPWPRLTPGFSDLRQRIDIENSIDHHWHGPLIGRAMISAGHTDFQEKAFEVHGLRAPDIYFTADVLDALRLVHPLDRQEKPSTLMLELARQAWASYMPDVHTWQELWTVYAGDSVEKDQAMAKAAGVPFELIHPETSKEAWQRVGVHLGLGQLVVGNDHE